MNLLQKIKQFLPVSSRSFHASHEDMLRIEQSFNKRIDETIEQLNNQTKELEEIKRSLIAHDTHIKMFAWEIYKKENESIEDAKKRFFQALPKATDNVRLLQLGCTKLLEEFDVLCKQNNIVYWLDCGTLLGAIRHKGFVPWDDDVDLGIMRDDLNKLIALTSNSDRYQITVTYDGYVYCKQVRFSYKNEAIPCFLDLFIYDWATKDNGDNYENHRKLKKAMIKEMEEAEDLLFWKEIPCYPANADHGNVIQCYFDTYIKKAQDCKIESKDENECIIWALDNLDDGKPCHLLFNKQDILPTETSEFEGLKLPIPRNADLALKSRYGNYLELPGDICSHYEHIDRSRFDNEQTKETIGLLLSNSSF